MSSRVLRVLPAIRDGVQSTVWAADGVAYAEGHDGKHTITENAATLKFDDSDFES